MLHLVAKISNDSGKRRASHVTEIVLRNG